MHWLCWSFLSLILCFKLPTLFLKLHHPFMNLYAVSLLPPVLLIECSYLLPCHPKLVHQALYPLLKLILANDLLKSLALVILNPLQTSHFLLQRYYQRIWLLEFVLKLYYPLQALLVVKASAQGVIFFLQGLHELGQQNYIFAIGQRLLREGESWRLVVLISLQLLLLLHREKL